MTFNLIQLLFLGSSRPSGWNRDILYCRASPPPRSSSSVQFRVHGGGVALRPWPGFCVTGDVYGARCPLVKWSPEGLICSGVVSNVAGVVDVVSFNAESLCTWCSLQMTRRQVQQATGDSISDCQTIDRSLFSTSRSDPLNHYLRQGERWWAAIAGMETCLWSVTAELVNPGGNLDSPALPWHTPWHGCHSDRGKSAMQLVEDRPFWLTIAVAGVSVPWTLCVKMMMMMMMMINEWRHKATKTGDNSYCSTEKNIIARRESTPYSQDKTSSSHWLKRE